VQNLPKADAKKGNGLVHAVVQTTRQAIQSLAAREKGLVGEHMVDYHELKRLGGSWTHDQVTGHWSPATIVKLNDQRRKGGSDKGPIHIKLSDLGEITRPGIDAVWQHGSQYTVTEAKASASVGAAYGIGRYKEKRGDIPMVTGLSLNHQLLHYLLSDSSDKGGTQTPLMQMSKAWVENRAPGEQVGVAATLKLKSAQCARRVVLVSLETEGAPAHVEALAQLNGLRPASPVIQHAEHGSAKEWEAAAIDAVDDARNAAHKAKAQAASQTSAPASRKKKKP
jgi:hypothetical protein